MRSTTIRSIALVVIFILMQGQNVAAELPLLLSPATLSGKTTTATFFGGVSSTGGQSFDTSFPPSDRLDVLGEIKVETAHIESSGNLYAVIVLGDDIYMRREDGSYMLWDQDPASLQPSSANKILQASEIISIIENIALGPLGLAGQTLSIYLAYSVNTVPDELYFNGAPLSFSIADYDPSQVIASSQTLLDTSVFDNDRDREIPLLIYLPEDSSPRPVLLFSHGNGLDRFISSYLGEHWSDRGYIVVAMQHSGSDSASGADGSLENFILRIEDVSAIIDQLETWDDDSSHSLYGRLDLDKIGMAGHSFGSKTTQAVSGQVITYLTEESRDPRIKAALALSPSLEGDSDPADQFGAVDIPWMLMTGTNDSLGGGTQAEDRLLLYPALPPGGKYELVLFGGEHLAFADVTSLSFLESQFARNPAHHPEISALTTAFWDSWLLSDSSARTWLDGDGVLSVLQPQDTWQLK